MLRPRCVPYALNMMRPLSISFFFARGLHGCGMRAHCAFKLIGVPSPLWKIGFARLFQSWHLLASLSGEPDVMQFSMRPTLLPTELFGLSPLLWIPLLWPLPLFVRQPLLGPLPYQVCLILLCGVLPQLTRSRLTSMLAG